jgi:tRNA threonylcarbamoyladenosine biosynthesis protein TsaE
MKQLSGSLEDTLRIASQFVESLDHSDPTKALVVGLSGELGSGKTTFVKFVAEALGVKETVTSPTFVIEKIYKINHPIFEHLIHIDAYRLEKSEELIHLGWEEMLQNPQNIILIEWPDRISDIIPPTAKIIYFLHIDENSREIEIKA